MNRAKSSSKASPASVHEGQPGPNAPAERFSELYVRSNDTSDDAPPNDRSVSVSRKLPVAVFTGSSAYPVVAGEP